MVLPVNRGSAPKCRASVNREAGGTKIEMGLDANGNGTLQDDEVSETAYVCHGTPGADGDPGADGSQGSA